MSAAPSTTAPDLVAVRLPGRAHLAIASGSFFDEHRELGADYSTRRDVRRVGSGFSLTTSLTVEQWAQLWRYVRSLHGAQEASLGDRDIDADVRVDIRRDVNALATALHRIATVVPQALLQS